MKKSVLLLNIVDKDISAFITKLQEIFNNKKSLSQPHITLRGPYLNKPKKEISEKINNFIKEKHKLEISNVGIFDNDGTYFVYFKVNGEWLKKISWKKEFPKRKYGFNPHITIYKGNDELYANKIYEFLKNQNIKMYCEKFDLEFYSIDKMYPQLSYNKNDLIIQSEYIKYINESTEFVKNILI